jgi:anti-sigma factor ChrR (cupin superfamily)
MADNPFAALVSTDDLDFPESGNAIKYLWYSDETCAWSAIIKARAGTVNAPHTHLGNADFYVISGALEYRGGFAKAGDWVYEPAGAVHEATTHPEDTVYLANVRGPIAFHGPDGKIAYVTNGEAARKALRG